MESKDKVIAIVLALFLGGFGIHRFYLGRNGTGVLMLLFFWTFIPAIIGFIDAIRYALMSDAEFARRYGTSTPAQTMNATEELERLAALKEKGHITEAEFQAKKAILLK